ncbi:Na+/H+ antiporter subunit E [Coralloluteibacterium stylophorae]|uniref:Na+/H+ antiporter subunit E n=1 Tax=Coralloluteibacterium stylophorae TaxID=1776034 RepID=A0A8J7VVT4_9GAMM|nr:Na+/H+ antiporter subunit E [Coralloluteibacterium stylophorae]MBS7457884.1 Na+/H+ antiporter subunit E [Coralloluteibacterium stylophorae]
MKRLLPTPFISIAIAVTWLLLWDSLAPGQLILAAVLAVAIPLVIGGMRGKPMRLRAPGAVLRLLWRVGVDILRGSIDVSQAILGRTSKVKPGFVWIRLDVTHDHAIAALAGIITLTPGTLSAELTEDRGHLLVHALDMGEAEALAHTIKARYESLLLEIFR